MCAIDDAEPWQFFAGEQIRKARKPHRCCECHREIAVGERYEYASGVTDGSWSDWKTCLQCAAAASWLMVECNGHLIGGVAEDLREHWRYGSEYESEWLARAIAGIDCGWRNEDGSLMEPLPPYKRAGEAA